MKVDLQAVPSSTRTAARKVLLLNPPFPLFPGESKYASPPLGLAYIAAILRQKGHDMRIVDAVIEGYDTETTDSAGRVVYGLATGEILSRIEAFAPHVLGISCVFSTLHRTVMELCAAIKARFPEITLVIGGTHATVLADELIANRSIDFIIRGEGEVAMCALLEHLAGQRPAAEVPGLTWKDSAGVHSNAQCFLDDIDELPFPARDLLEMEAYFARGVLQGALSGVRATTVITSRGCPASCVFCSIHSVWGRPFRGHSPAYVLAELEHLRKDFGIHHIVFEDDNLTFDRKRAGAIFQGMVDQKMNLTWSAPNGVAVWCLDDTLLELIRNSGCKELYLAVESGDPDTLKKIIRKPLNLAKVVEIARTCRRLGITVQAFLVMGLPGETLEAMTRSLDFATRLPVDRISIAVATPYPGTPLYDLCRKDGYIPQTLEFDGLMTRKGIITTPEFTPEDVERMVSKGYVQFALRHPLSTLTRLAKRASASPGQTCLFVAHRLRSLVGRSARPEKLDPA